MLHRSRYRKRDPFCYGRGDGRKKMDMKPCFNVRFIDKKIPAEIAQISAGIIWLKLHLRKIDVAVLGVAFLGCDGFVAVSTAPGVGIPRGGVS